MKALVTISLAVLGLSGAAAAQVDVGINKTDASWQVCNETSFVLRMAVAAKNTANMSARGWQRLRPGACLDVDAAPGQERFVYAESSAAYQGGIREWAGRTPFCVGETNFQITSAEACQAAGYETRNYLAVDAEESVTKFVEPDNYSRRADIAGIQRLLRENGYRVSRIDGVDGRRTGRTLASFIKDKKLAANLTADQQLDALEKAAITRISELGVTFCNKTSHQVWTAVGQRVKDDWESRGWWPVDAGTCIQPITTALIGSRMHVFARQEQPVAENGTDVPDKHLRSETAEPNQFCISGARFTSRGREACQANGYEVANFRVVPADKDGVVVNLTDADFVTPSSTGLRR